MGVEEGVGSFGVVKAKMGRRKGKARIVREVGVLGRLDMYTCHFWERQV